MLRQITRLSPSRAYVFEKCPLTEVFRSNNWATQLPVSPAGRVGSICHNVLADAASGKIRDRQSFETRWDNELKKIEEEMSRSGVDKHLVPLMESARTYEVKKLQTWRLVLKGFLGNGTTSPRSQSVKSEEWFESSTGKLAGRIDLLITRNGATEIIDFKTGKIVDDTGNPKEEYIYQLKLYAALYHEKRGEWPVRLVLVGLDQDRLETNFSPEECDQLLTRLVEVMDSVNRQIVGGTSEPELASPSPEVCKYCSYRPSCSSYWAHRKDTDDWPTDVSGEVVDKTISGIKLVRVVLDNKGIQYIVRGLSSRHGLHDSTPDNLLICNLAKDRVSGQFVENEMTTVFKIYNHDLRRS